MEENEIIQEKSRIIEEVPTPARRKIPKWVFIGEALLAAAAIAALIFSGFWKTYGERVELSDGVEAAEGKMAYFTVDISYGSFAERYNTITGDVNGRYLLCDYNGTPLTVIVPNAQFESAEQMRELSMQKIRAYIYGGELKEISGAGYVRELTESELNLAYGWFDQNKGIFENTFVDVSDAANIIGTHVVVMDYIGSMSITMSVALVNLSLVLLMLMLALPVLGLLPVKKSELSPVEEPESDADAEEAPNA